MDLELLRRPRLVLNRLVVGWKLAWHYHYTAVSQCLCGGRVFSEISGLPPAVSVPVAICRSCGLIAQTPRLDDSSLREFYRSDYRRFHRGSSVVDRDYFLRGIRRGDRILTFLEGCGVGVDGWTVAEVGCGPGGILKGFQRRGCQVIGADLDEECVRYANVQGIQVLQGSIEALAATGVKVDLLILSHLLEHLPDPLWFLRLAAGLIEADGLLYVEVPGLRNPGLEPRRLFQLAHLWYFDWVTLSLVGSAARLHCSRCDEAVQALFRPCSANAGPSPQELVQNYSRNVGVIQRLGGQVRETL